MKSLLTSNQIVRRYVRMSGQRIALWRGRTDGIGWAHNSVPIRVIDGEGAPVLSGAPYWKTAVRNGSFRRILYTPSTLRIEVGANWLRRHAASDCVRDEIYSDDTH